MGKSQKGKEERKIIMAKKPAPAPKKKLNPGEKMVFGKIVKPGDKKKQKKKGK